MGPSLAAERRRAPLDGAGHSPTDRQRSVGRQLICAAPAWLPDWHWFAGYPDSTLWYSKPQWAWEFLRRDRAFQKDWAEGNSDLRTTAGSLPAGPPFRAIADKYNLHKPKNPASPSPPVFVTVCSAPPIIFPGKHCVRVDESEVLIRLDKHLPLKPQLARATRWLLQMDEGLKHCQRAFQWRPKDWLRYLRLLDAIASEAPRGEILEKLYCGLYGNPKRGLSEYEQRLQRFKDDRRAAKRLCCGGYKRILG
jgi:hypothetical protein